MFGVFLFVAALQGPWSVTPPRSDRADTTPEHRGIAQPRPRLDIDLSGLSDDDAVSTPLSSSTRPRVPTAARDLVWSPRLNGIARQGGHLTQAATPAPAVATLTIADLDDPTDSRIDPAIADLIGSVQLPMVSNPGALRQRRQASAATTHTLAVAPAPQRRYEPGRW